MIRAFNLTDKVYQTNGDAVIAATKARVKNEDNGDFTLDLTCSSDYSDFIQANNIIVVPTPQGDQAFRVRQVEKRSNRIEAKCYHVFYDAENFLIADSYAVNMTAEQALRHFNDATDTLSPFTMDSNITTLNNLRIVRGSLAEAVISVIERWGGHLVRDNYNIAVKGAIGVDNGITIEYKKNLKELTASYDWSDVVTKLLPVGKDGVLLDNLYVYSDTQYAIPFTKTITFEQDIEREDYPSDEAYVAALKADLRQQAQNYVNIACVPTINYTLKGNPEKVTDIGDIIEVKDARIGVNVLTKVIAYEYDAITKKYVNLEFGNFTPKLSSLMSDIKAETSLQIASATSNINIEVNSINNNITELNTIVNNLNQNKQNKLIAGQNITITSNNVISATSERGIDVLYGEDTPNDNAGENKDFYLKMGNDDVISDSDYGVYSTQANPITLNNFTKVARNTYNFVINGTPSNDGNGETLWFPLHDLIDGNTYTLTLTLQFNSGATFPYPSYREGITIGSAVGSGDYVIDFADDTQEHTYTATFTYHDDDILTFCFYTIKDNVPFTATITNFNIAGDYISDAIDEIYNKHLGKWRKYNPQGASSVSDLTDVEINDLANGDILEYDEVLQKWKNTANSGGGGNAIILDAQIYSIDEKQVGVWIDGRPLYQKTFERSVTLVSGTWTPTGDSIPNGKAICAEVTAINTSSDTVPVWCEIGSDGHIELLNIRNVGSVTITQYTVKYFKTTDRAGSGGYQAYGFSPIIYSEEEREVGVWIDNKPLYQKTWKLTNEVLLTSSGIQINAIDTSGMESLVECVGSYSASANAKTIPILAWKYNNNTYYGSSIQAYVDIITLYYTKTTDTAGSGKYNTLGVPNVHYTEDEQVIGTYLGKPLYQKTFVANMASGATTCDIPFTGCNLGRLVAFTAICDTTTPSGMSIPCTINGIVSGNNGGITIKSLQAYGEYGFVDDTGVRITRKYAAWYENNMQIEITIKYTKTTD